ncbi:VPA1269 family protein [Rhizobium phaseoli]|uniref:VPA1269 family protein n=1 Tax=Rhizobium phaseoli TaxID=396 RepID=UPI00031BDE76|nr:VPA1269 family protein [Rhizobium phaseoli]KKZ88537.1 integrase [Rhizobium phaseoli Ch24-10]
MKYYFTATNGDDIFLNLSREDRKDEVTCSFLQEEETALNLIKSAGVTKRITAAHLEAVDVVYDAGICISPWTIFRLPMHRDICSHFNGISEFGWSLREALDAVGAFSFLESVNNRATAQAIIERILAVFTISASGLSAIGDAPLDFIHTVVDFFRSRDGMGWNNELLGVGGIPVQCLSNVVNGLAKIYQDESLLQKARKHRSPSAGKNPSWHALLYSKDALDQELLALVREFMQDSRMRPGLVEAATLSILSWLKEIAPNETVRDAVFTASRTENFTAFLKRRNGGMATRTMLTTVEAARKISVSITEQLAESAAGRAMFDLVALKEVNRLKNEVKKLPKPGSTRSRPLPEKLIPIMREILEEGAKGWPGKSGLFKVETIEKNKTVLRYCPVIPSLFRAMLDIPLRMGQIRRLDSGEGDVVHFNADRMDWEANTGPLAGYWPDVTRESWANMETRGYARQIQDEIKPVTGINVNTNKTGEPYVIPWYIPSLLKNLWDLRKWQEKHNPITEPVGPEVYLDAPHRYPESTKAGMPHIFPISRLFPNKFWPTPGRIATHSELDHAWCWLLAEIQRRWNERHPGNQVTLVEIHPKSKQPYRPRYNIHGLRVRGLTDLRRGGMPLDLLSKFVAGHATLRMTIYYTEPHPTEISEAIEKAVANSELQRQYIDDLKRMDVDEAKRRTVSISPTAVSEAIDSGSQFQFCNVSIGICPYDGSRCGDGGELLRKEETNGVSKNVYGEIKGRNCVMCRHFLSGPPWLNELADYGTKLCERRQFLAHEQDRIDELVARYENELRAKTITKAFFENKYDALQAEIIQVKNDQELVENSIFNVERLCKASVQLLDATTDEDAGVMLVASNRSSVVEYRQISEFEQAVRITAAGRVHQILGDERVEGKRDQYLDVMLFNSGQVPPRLMTNISPEHRRRAMDQYALFIHSRASSEEIDRLVDGTLRLRDMGLEEQVRNLISVALSDPIPLPGTTVRRQPAALEAIA